MRFDLRNTRNKKGKSPVKGLLVNVLEEIILTSQSYLSAEMASKLDAFFQLPHVKKLAKNLIAFYQDPSKMEQPKPHFETENTPDLEEPMSFFRPFMKKWTASVNLAEIDEKAEAFARILMEAGISNLLLLIGQRITAGSIRDERAIPPTRKTMINSAVMDYNEELTIAARAMAKHSGRSDIRFWGDISGDSDRKNKKARQLVEKVLKGYTWWNAFVHPTHGPVYEARLSSGHGARWSIDGQKFIGFLEPYLEE